MDAGDHGVDVRFVLWISAVGCSGPLPANDVARDSGTVTTSASEPSSFLGIPSRPYAGVEVPANGTVPLGAASCIGTPSAPAFLIGDGAEFTPPDGKWELDAQYCIVANVNVRGRLLARTSEMVEFRQVEVHHADGNCLGLGGTDIAVVDSHVHHCRGDNGHGVQPGCGTARVWVTGTTLEYNDEDGFQSGHRCTDAPPDELYFYGNTCNNNRENCFDLKWTGRAVVSGNHMQRHRRAEDGVDFQFDDGSWDGDVSSGSDGAAVVIGSDGTPSTTFLFDNHYEDNLGCVRVEDAGDVFGSAEQCRDALPESQWGGYKFDKSGHTRLVDSTFHDVPFMLTDSFRDGPRIEEGGNRLEGATEFRQGYDATVSSGEVTHADVAMAYEAAFGRPL